MANAHKHGHNWDFDPGLELEDARLACSLDEVRTITLANDLAAVRGRIKLWLDAHSDHLPPYMVGELKAIAGVGA